MTLSKLYFKSIFILFLAHNADAYSQAIELRIDPRGAIVQEISAKEIFSSITYLPLEPNQGNLFGN